MLFLNGIANIQVKILSANSLSKIFQNSLSTVENFSWFKAFTSKDKRDFFSIFNS